MHCKLTLAQAAALLLIALRGFGQVAPPAVYPVSSTVNYVRSWTALAPDTDRVHLVSRPVTDVHQATAYVDGLGRPLQTVVKQISPAGNDLVTATVYDAFGREQYKYLPFVSNTSASVNDNATDGNFKMDPFQQQAAFALPQYPGETYYYGQENYEASPLSRPQASYAPGNSWVGSSRGVGVQYLINTTGDSVRLWSAPLQSGGLPTTSGMYLPKTLSKTVTTDEQGHQVVEFKDIEGKTLLKKVQLTATPGTGHVGWLCTYYIYDDLGNLRFVLQPRAIDLIMLSGTWVLSSISNLTTELCFRYEYDYRNRMMIKKVPGAGEVWLVYDARERLVMTQDSNLRALGKWLVTKYDAENRSDSTGLLTDGNNRIYHQNLAGSSTAYPGTTSNFELLTQTFYDGYGWAASQGLVSTLNTTYTGNSSYFITGYNSSPNYAQPITQYPVARGMMTGSLTKVIGTTSQFLPALSFFDDHGRVIETHSINQTGGKDTVVSQYDFSGKLLRNLVCHQKAGTNAQGHIVFTKMSYDAGGRLTAITKNIDHAVSDQQIAANTYDELGQLTSKQVGNNLDNLAYTYNIRGWLSSINKAFVSGTANPNGNWFGMELGYDKSTCANGATSYTGLQYNGNIAGVLWRSRGDGIGRKYDFTYDNVNRLTGATFNQYTGSVFDQSAGIDFSVSNLTYDGNGNILSMNQKGFTVGGSALIDQLTYTYQTNSNKLSQVNDAMNNPSSLLGDFHYNGSKQPTDYSYDGNGNLVTDNNKAITGINYNYLNLPQGITVTAKGTVAYTYDASGNKLYKITTDNSVAPAKTTQTTYVDGFVYQAVSPAAGGPVGPDTLQFLSQEESLKMKPIILSQRSMPKMYRLKNNSILKLSAIHIIADRLHF